MIVMDILYLSVLYPPPPRTPILGPLLRCQLGTAQVGKILVPLSQRQIQKLKPPGLRAELTPMFLSAV